MAIVRCDQGHFYDDRKFSLCPHCGIFAHTDAEEQKTAALRPQSQSDQKTVAMKAIEAEPEEDGKTIGMYSGARGNDVVTGWLVCISGPEKGRDYRLGHGFNRVGRSYQMNVCIVDDPKISRECHCSIVYDGKTNRFSLVPSAGALSYYNGDLLQEVVLLYTGDLIGMGESEFEFIAFCREGRVWEHE